MNEASRRARRVDGPAHCSVPLVVRLARRRVGWLHLRAGRLGPRSQRARGLKERGLTATQFAALQATARDEVYRTRTGSAYTLTGPCSSQALWALLRLNLIADPANATEDPRYQMVVTEKGRAALASLVDVPKKR